MTNWFNSFDSFKKVLFLPILSIVSIHGYSWHKATDIIDNLIKKPLPLPSLKNQRSPSLNGKGSIFYTPSPLADEFIRNECKPHKRVLEIGTGFSPIAFYALKNGVSEYIANDLSFEHLQLLVQDILTREENPRLMLERLTLFHGHVPQNLPDCTESYDAILLDKVIHFMNPLEIEQLLIWSKKALKSGGKWYILTTSPYLAACSNELLTIYEVNKMKGHLYPGYIDNIFRLMPLDQIPDFAAQTSYPLTFFCKEDLEDLFIRHGFIINSSYITTLSDTDAPVWRMVHEDQKGLVALVAQKK